MPRHFMLDIRGMEPPAPLERVLGTIADFRAGDTLKVLSDFEPFPLYRILEREGVAHRTEPGDAAACEVTIWSRV